MESDQENLKKETAFKLPCLHAKLLCYAKSLQSCPTLCDPIDGNPPGSPIPGILQARTLEWVAISFFNAWKWNVKVKLLSRVQLLATPRTAAYQAPPSMGLQRVRHDWATFTFIPIPHLRSSLLPQQCLNFHKRDLKSMYIQLSL